MRSSNYKTKIILACHIGSLPSVSNVITKCNPFFTLVLFHQSAMLSQNAILFFFLLVSFRSKMSVMFVVLSSGGSKGGRPPTDQNFLNFMQFWGKSGKFVCWRPLRGWRPLLRGILYPPLLRFMSSLS